MGIDMLKKTGRLGGISLEERQHVYEKPVQQKAYYALPDLNAERDTAEAALRTTQKNMQDKLAERDATASELKKMEAAVALLNRETEMRRQLGLPVTMDRQGQMHTRLLLAQYPQLESRYKTAQSEAEKLYGNYTKAVDTYNATVKNQQAMYQDWRQTIRDADTVQKELTETKKQINGKRISGASAEDMQILTDKKALLEEELGWSQYFYYSDLQKAEDFETASANRNFANPTRENLSYFDAMMDTSQWRWDDEGNQYDTFGNRIDMNNVDERGIVIHPLAGDERYRVQDPYGMWANATEEDRRIAAAASEYAGGYDTWANAILDGDTYFWGRLEKPEVDTYYYLLNTKGTEAATAYLDYMEVELARRETGENTGQWEERYNKAGLAGKALMNVASIPANVFGGTMAFIDDTARQLKGEEINPYSGPHGAMHFANTVRGETAEYLDKTGLKIPGIDFTLGDLYQTGMSRLDSALATAIGGGLGTVLLGTGAASNEAYRLYQQGASEEQVLLGAWAAGAAETVFEYLSFDKLVKMKDAKTVGQWVKNALMQGGIEASEEGFTEASNIITNAIIMQDESDWQKLVEENGGSKGGALGDAVLQALHSMFGGFLGGFGAGAVQGGKTYINTKRQQVATGDQSTNATAGENAQAAGTDDALTALTQGQDTTAQQQVGQEQGAADVGTGDALQELTKHQLAEQAETGTTQDVRTEQQTMEDPQAVTNDITDENVNGGNEYGNIQQQSQQSADAGLASWQADAGADLLHGGSQRNDGAGTGEQAGGLAGGAGPAATGRGARSETRRVQTTIARQNLAGHLRLEKVSALEIGLKNGTNNKNLQILPKEYWSQDAELQELAQKAYRETGMEPVFVVGKITVKGKGGGIRTVRAALTDSKLIVRADYAKTDATLDQLVDHEIFHAKARSARADGFDLNAMIEEKILERYTQEEFEAVLDAYLDALDGLYGVQGAESWAQYEAAVARVKEELFADAYAGINAFGVNAGEFTDTVDESLDRLHLGRNSAQENGVRQTDGPPDGENYSVNESYADEINNWIRSGMPGGEQFVLGTTGDVLQGLGAIESDIYILGDKIKTILQTHPEMTEAEIKKIPQIVEDPILILKSRGADRGNRANTRLVIFGSVKAQNGQPVLTVLDLRPVENDLVVEDMQKITSAYTKSTNPAGFVRQSEIVYADKKRTARLLRTIGFYMPIELQQSGYIGSISYFGQNVNINGKPFASVFRESDTENFSSADRTTTADSEERFSAEEYDNPLLALTGERKTAQKNTAQDGGERYSSDGQGADRISLEMSDTERSEILREKNIVAPIYTGEADSYITNDEDLKSGKRGLIKAALLRIGEEFDVFSDYNIADVDVHVSLSRGNLSESITKDANPTQLAKLLPMLKETVEYAVGIECHANRYFYDNTTSSFENLLGGYIDGEYFVPVRFGLKHIKDGQTVLYVIVDQKKIKAEVLKTTTQQDVGSAISRSASTYNVAQIVQFVNSKDLLRYLPDDMLSVEQKKIKQEGIAETIKYTNNKNDSKYAKFIAAGNMQAVQSMVNAAAKSTGYTIRAYHGTSSDFWTFEKGNKRTKGKLNFGEGFYFTPDRSMAENYTSTGRVVDAFLKLDNPYTFYGTRFYNDDLSQMSLQFGKEVTIENVTEVLQQMGYDGIVARNYDGATNPVNQYVVFDANKIKSADPITYDDDGNVIPISERFNQENDDIRYSTEEELSDEEWEQLYGLSLPSLDESENNFVDKTSANVENDNTNRSIRSEQHDYGRVREGTAETAEGWGYNRGTTASSAGVAQETQRWKDQTSSVQRVVKKCVKKHINRSPNAADLFDLLCSYVGRTDETITPYTYNKAIGILSEKVFDDAISLHPVVFENKWSVLGGSITNLRNAIVDSLDVADSKGSLDQDRYSAEEDDNPLLALKGEAKPVDYAALESQYAAENRDHREQWFTEKLGEDGYQKYREFANDRDKQKKQQSREEQAQKTREKKARIDEKAQEKIKKLTEREEKAKQAVKPTKAKKELKAAVLDMFSIPSGQRAELGSIIDGYAERLLKNGTLTEEDRKHFFDRLYDAGVMTVPADEYHAAARSHIAKGRIYVSPQVKAEFGDDWNGIRKRAFGARVYLVNDRSAASIDQWNATLSAEDMLPELFNSEDTDQREILERIIQVAEYGAEEKMSLAEYTAMLSGQGYVQEDAFLDSMERKLDWTLRTFAQSAGIEISVKESNIEENAKLTRESIKQAARRAAEREERKESARRSQAQKELRELQQKTLKQLQWLSKNRNRAPEELRDTWDEVLGDIDLYAVGAADEMRWSEKHQATWKDLAEMYKHAKEYDPNFLPSDELQRIVDRLDGDKIADMDIGALQDLYKAAVGLRTEFYNRNNVINDEMRRLFAEVYTDAKGEIEKAPGGYAGKKLDKLFNLDQLTPMNVLQRMGGWDPKGAFYSMARQLEKGERDIRAYTVKANRLLNDFLTEHEDWVKRADGQGKDAIWYELEVPELLELGMGDKPIFGDTVKVYMTPAQKVHLYLESKNQDNLRHMTGGRTFADKELYSKGKRQEAFAQGKSIRLAPETVKQIVSDLTAEEMELARVLEQYYNTFAKQEINRVSNILYGYDKAMGSFYAPIYTNRNYTKTEIGVFDTTAEGVGNLKERQISKNPTYNIGAFDAFERHVDQTARFCGMAIPARNWTTLLNWQEKNNSTGDVITHKWGEEGKQYITDLITALQAGEGVKTDTVSSGADKLQSNYIASVFGANPSIVLKQLGSIPMASAYLGVGNIPSLKQIGAIDRSFIAKYTQDLDWRMMGYTTPETKFLKDNPNWTKTNKFTRFTFGGGAITAMDGWAASVLWPWAENKVRSEHPDLELGTQAQIDAGESPFYKKVAEAFEDAVARSQSVSDEIHQSVLRKSKNPVTRAFTLFRSDSAQTYNTIRQKIGEARYAIRSGEDKAAVKAAKTAAGAAFMALAVNAVWGESVSLLMALVKNMGKYYRDDEEELTAESVFSEMVKNMIESMAGTVIYGEKLCEVIGNVITGDKWYGIETPGMEQLNDVVDEILNAGKGMKKFFAGAVDVVNNGGDIGQYLDANSNAFLGCVKDVAETIAKYVAGVPVGNIEAYLLGTIKWVCPQFAAAYEDTFAETEKSDLPGLSGEALSGRISRVLGRRGMDLSDETVDCLASLYEAGYSEAISADIPGSVTVEDVTHELGAYQQQAYGDIWNQIAGAALEELVASERFATLDEEMQAKALSRLYSYATAKAKEQMFDGYVPSSSAETIDELTSGGLDLAECISWLTSTSGMNRGEKYAELRTWAMSDEKKRAVIGSMIGTDMKTDAGNPTEYAKLLEAMKQGITVDEYLDMKSDGVDLDDYLELTENGMDSDTAYEFANRMEELEADAGEGGLENLDKWRLCVDFSPDTEDQLAALAVVMSDAQIASVEAANKFGVTPDMYVSFYELRSQHDADKNGSYTQSEVTATIQARFSHLTQKQKAVLWQVANSSTKSAKNNPYSREIGQKVLDAKAAAKG